MSIKNNQGFTLIELLVTVMLIAVISLITFVSIASVINKSKSNECNALKNNIENAAKEYFNDERLNDTYRNQINNNRDIEITAQFLIDRNYLIDKGTSVKYENIIVKVNLNNDGTINAVKEIKSSDEETFKDCN